MNSPFTPTINIYSDSGLVQLCGCGSGLNQTVCGCGATPQNTIATQTLPNPTTPCPVNGPIDPRTTDEVLWMGPPIPARGIKTGDSLSKIISLIMQTLP